MAVIKKIYEKGSSEVLHPETQYQAVVNFNFGVFESIYIEKTGIDSIQFYTQTNQTLGTRCVNLGYSSHIDENSYYSLIICGATNSIADATSAFVGGDACHSTATYSMTFGYQLLNNYDYKLAIGHYNKDVKDVYFEIGCGNNIERKNCFEIYNSGKAVSYYNITNQDGDFVLVNKKYIREQLDKIQRELAKIGITIDI